MSASSSARPSSTFWIIDTTSVSGTFTTTATFTLWVPLNTPSTTLGPSSSTTNLEPSGDPAPRSNTPAIAGSVIGSILGISLVLTYLVLYYKRRVRRTVVKPRTKPADTPYGSEHALLDLAAEPAPDPQHIEPWVAPAAVRRPNKAQNEARRDEVWREGSSTPREGAAPRAESLSAGAPATSSTTPRGESSSSAERRTQPNTRTHTAETHGLSATPGSTSHGHDPMTLPPPVPSQPRLHLHQPEALATGTKSTAVPRRRAPREPSPPRLEEDAGVSLMRGGDDALPPSYGDLVHDRVPPGTS
ncbi:unnamed protein product [Rhizoctonia solani]|uniref:Uncharacterized protein n=1 Tax=Rhizoctonia solani TaxID=456999 RepID=A0A8H3CEI7_9AGAM|nr:unnamed protein product [Rhizoctonia solani]